MNPLNRSLIKRSALLIVLITSLNCVGQRTTGLVFDDKNYQQTDRISPALKFSGGAVPAFSLKKYCPVPGDQKRMGSCVAWATGYAAMTVSTAIQNNNTNTTEITDQAMSALYIFNQIQHNGCPNGTRINDALDLIQTKGDCLRKDFDPDDCEVTPTADIHQLAAAYKIKDFYTLFDLEAAAEQKIIATINSINSKKPVVVGMKVTPSLFNVSSNGEWNPELNENIDGGHALCVIGYDNIKERFEILNSWGTSWGNKGYFTISYKNYGRLCKYGYQFSLLNKKKEPTINLTGDFKLKKFKGYDALTDKYEFVEVPVGFQNGFYTITGGLNLNDFFRLSASNIPKDKYVYIFSIKPDKTAEILFPLERIVDGVTIKDIPIVPANNVTIEIPADEKKGMTTDQAGEDILCILYSAEIIEDIETVVRNIKNENGDFYLRLQKALGYKLISAGDIQYNTSMMGITTNASKGSIAPIILKVSVK